MAGKVDAPETTITTGYVCPLATCRGGHEEGGLHDIQPCLNTCGPLHRIHDSACPNAPEVAVVEIPRWAVEILTQRNPPRCGVCRGASPSWDGHDANPPCIGAAREAAREAL